MKHFHFHLPGYFYSMEIYDNVTSLAQACQWLRDWLKVDRLPAGTEVWSEK